MSQCQGAFRFTRKSRFGSNVGRCVLIACGQSRIDGARVASGFAAAQPSAKHRYLRVIATRACHEPCAMGRSPAAWRPERFPRSIAPANASIARLNSRNGACASLAHAHGSQAPGELRAEWLLAWRFAASAHRGPLHRGVAAPPRLIVS
jgi:hypothetical protein